MNIVIAGHFVFPTGSASASRIRHMAKGLTEIGHKVHVIIMAPVKTDEDNPEKPEWYNYEGIAYYYAAGWFTLKMRKNRTNKLVKFLTGIHRGLKESIRQVTRLHEQIGVDVLIGYSNFYFGMHGIIKFCRKKGIPVVRDVVEWLGPEDSTGGRFSPLFWNSELNFHFSIPKSDGVIAISQFLTDRFSAKGIKVIRIPAIIDPGNFASKLTEDKGHPHEMFQLTYLGIMNQRDCPMLMMKAVREVLKAGSRVFFNVVGTDGSRAHALKAKKYAANDPILKDHIKFWGRVSDQQVIERLSNSDALIFTRLQGRAAKAAFPTRLPEYLMTGKPAITSDVSDIAEYLIDGKEAIIVNPDSVEALTEGITKLIKLPDHGKAIGQAGKEKCSKCFNYLSRCKEISAFIEDLVLAKNRKRARK